MSTLPQGKITIVFTDIEDSSRMTADLGNPAYMEMRASLNNVLLSAFNRHDGFPVDTKGDSFMAVFSRANDALACVNAIQTELSKKPIARKGATKSWMMQIRIGVHTAEQEISPRLLSYLPPESEMVAGNVEYSGSDTNFASRISSQGCGGQIIVSDSTYRAADTRLQYQWKNWPDRRLKSFEASPQTVWELLYEGQTRGEPGTRWVPEWYLGELNRYIPRPELQAAVIDHFKLDQGGNRTRLVTLQGEGGMGKTRLAVACAIEMSGLFQDGVYFVDLTRDETNDAFRTREAVAQAIGVALGFTGADAQPEMILSSLRNTEKLLILDNYESVDSQEVRQFVRDLMTKTKSLCLLVTGRHYVGLQDCEQIVLLDEGMTEAEARNLFLSFARLGKGNQWTPNQTDEAQLKRILNLTLRIPLAVELAAGWASMRTLKQIADGLEETPLGQMTHMRNDIDRIDPSPHHHSLLRSLDWSYSLLKEGTSTVFAAVSLFATSFTPESVAATTSQKIEQTQGILDYLVSKSLVRRIEFQETSRYSLHRFTHAYAVEKLFPLPEKSQIFQHFVTFYVQKVMQYNNINDVNSRIFLTTEWQNAIAAVNIAHKSEDSQSVMRLSDLSDFLSLVGLWAEEERLFNTTLISAQNSGDKYGEGRALNGVGNVFQKQGRWKEAVLIYTESRIIFRHLQDMHGEATALTNLATVYKDQGMLNEARETNQQGLAIYRKINDKAGEASALTNLAVIYKIQGMWDEALKVALMSLTIFRSLADKKNEGLALGNIGNIYKEQNKWDEAESSYQQSLTIFQELGYKQSEGITLGNLAVLYHTLNRWDEAEDYYNQNLIIMRELRDWHAEAETLFNLAYLMGSQMKFAEALIFARKAETTFAQTEDIMAVARVKEWADGLEKVLGDMPRRS